MNVVFIIIMVIGIALFAISFFMKSEEEKPVSIPLSKTEPKISDTKEKKSSKQVLMDDEDEKENKSAANDAIEAAKKKAKEAVSGFDLHLNNDSSNQTVEELERDLLGGLDLSDTDGAPAEEDTADVKKATQSSKGSSKKKNRSKKNNYPKNDRYDDLLFEETDVKETVAEEVQAVEEKVEKTEKASSKNNKKGKKK